MPFCFDGKRNLDRFILFDDFFFFHVRFFGFDMLDKSVLFDIFNAANRNTDDELVLASIELFCITMNAREKSPPELAYILLYRIV